MSDRLSLKWNDKEIQNRPLRFLIVAISIPLVALAIVAVAILTPMMIVALLPLHGALRLLGRNGLVKWDQYTFSYTLDRQAFARREHAS